jgi:hypothetical protein
MSDWIHNLPVVWMSVVIFGFTYIATAALYAFVVFLARHERARSLKAVSPGVLSPLGTLFGLFVAFTAVQVWNDNLRSTQAVDREASSLKSVLVLAAAFPPESQRRLHDCRLRSTFRRPVHRQTRPVAASSSGNSRSHGNRAPVTLDQRP